MDVIFKRSLLLLLLLFNISSLNALNALNAQVRHIPYFMSSDSFFPDWPELKNENIEWGYLVVPEKWNDKKGKIIKLAIAVIHSTSKYPKPDPVVFIQGGPGGSSISGLWRWLRHPIRKNRDIILIDLRGTGFSKPSLCPDLGKKFMKVLAENDTPNQDIKGRVKLAIKCKTNLIKKGIDISAYNSISIAYDLHALKTSLGYKTWDVYGVSYGTYIALTYFNKFPKDIKSLILDSPITPNDEYYNKNTSNYVRALNVLFKKCRDNTTINRSYPNLEKVFYSTLIDLEKKPMEVDVSKKIDQSGKFVLNAEDMMLAVQQALYNRKLIEILPLMIYQIHNGNKDLVASLIGSLGRRLFLDYGTYYCMLCNETIPCNSINKFNEDAQKYKLLPDGLTFYKGDFYICNKWNDSIRHDSCKDIIIINNKSALILSGEFDPITSPSNGKQLVKYFPHGYFVEIPSFSHAPSLSKCGSKLVTAFLNNPKKKPKIGCFKLNKGISFITNIKINGGIIKFANSLNKPNIPFLIPFILAILAIIIMLPIFIVSFFRTNRKINLGNLKIKNILIVGCSLLGLLILIGLVLAIKKTTETNIYILAFGLPSKYNYIFLGLYLLVVFTVIALILFLLSCLKLKKMSLISLVSISAMIIINIYFIYWGLLL